MIKAGQRVPIKDGLWSQGALGSRPGFAICSLLASLGFHLLHSQNEDFDKKLIQ